MKASFKLWALLTLSLAALPMSAHAADAVISFTVPTTNIDGSAIPATGPGSLVSTRIQWGTCTDLGAFGVLLAGAVVPMPALTYTITGLEPGSYCVRAFSKNTYAEESNASNVVKKVIAGPKPRPPTLL